MIEFRENSGDVVRSQVTESGIQGRFACFGKHNVDGSRSSVTQSYF